jgi:hypothetical protein
MASRNLYYMNVKLTDGSCMLQASGIVDHGNINFIFPYNTGDWFRLENLHFFLLHFRMSHLLLRQSSHIISVCQACTVAVYCGSGNGNGGGCGGGRNNTYFKTGIHSTPPFQLLLSFNTWLKDVRSEYDDALDYSTARYSSGAEIQCWLFYLQTGTQAYVMTEKSKTAQLLRDEKWAMALAFITYITTCLHELRVKLQGKRTLPRHVVYFRVMSGLPKFITIRSTHTRARAVTNVIILILIHSHYMFQYDLPSSCGISIVLSQSNVKAMYTKSLVLLPSCVPEKAGVNQNRYSHTKKGFNNYK